MPLPQPNSILRKFLKDKVLTLGELCVPREYKRIYIDKDGCQKIETCHVSSRKILLKDIRKRTLDRHREMNIMRAPLRPYSELEEVEIDSRLSSLHMSTSADADYEAKLVSICVGVEYLTLLR